MTGTKKWGNTISKKGEASRIFIGNLNPRQVNCEDLEKIFGKYGKIQGVDINPNGFAFIQFETPEEAQKAVDSEQNAEIQGKLLEVKMFDKSNQSRGKRDRDRSRSPNGRGSKFHRSGRNSGYMSPPPFDHYPQEHGPFRPMFPPNPDMMNNAYYQYGPNMMPPVMMPPPEFNHAPNNVQPYVGPPRPMPGANELEILVINRDQTEYAELVKRRVSNETSLKLVDTLFLHSAQRISMTLNDLYERRTFYAIVIGPMNEQNKTCTLHILHNQTEHRNLPLKKGIEIIQHDYCNFVGLKDPAQINYQSNIDNANVVNSNPMPASQAPYNGPNNQDAKVIGTSGNEYSPYGMPPSMSSASGSKMPAQMHGGIGLKPNLGAVAGSSKLPEEVRYALRSTLEDNSAQFLSLSQFDLVINFYQREREKLTAYQKGNSLEYGGAVQSGTPNDTSKDNLLENPQVKAALNSLFQMGAIHASALTKGATESSGSYMNGSAQSAQANASGPIANYPVAVAGQSTDSGGYMYESNSYKNAMVNQANSTYASQYHDAPSYLSTESIGNAQGTIASDMYPTNASMRRMDSPNRGYRSVRSSRFQ